MNVLENSLCSIKDSTMHRNSHKNNSFAAGALCMSQQSSSRDLKNSRLNKKRFPRDFF